MRFSSSACMGCLSKSHIFLCDGVRGPTGASDPALDNSIIWEQPGSYQKRLKFSPTQGLRNSSGALTSLLSDRVLRSQSNILPWIEGKDPQTRRKEAGRQRRRENWSRKVKEKEGVLSLSFLSRHGGIVEREVDRGVSEGENIQQTLSRSPK